MAASDARPVPRKAVAYRVTFPILDADGDLVTAAATLDSEISKDGGTFADCTNEATEIATSSGMYFLDLTSTEMDADTVAIIVKTGTAGAKTTPIVMYPEEVGDFRADVVQVSGDTTAADNAEAFFDGTGYAGTNNVIPTVTTTTTATNVTTVNGLAANVITAASMAADASAEIADAVWDEDATGHQTQGTFGQAIGDPVADADTIWGLVNTNLDATVSSRASSAALATVQADTDDIQTRLPAALVSGRMDSSVGAVATGAITAAAIADGAIDRATFAADTGLQTIRSNTAQAGAAGTITLDASASATDDFYNDNVILLTGLTGVGQIRGITDYVGATKVATIKPNWATTPDATTTFAILPRASVWDEVTADHVDSGSTGNSLNSAGSAGDPWSTALPGAYGAGTAGKIVGDNVNATISSRASQTSVDTIDDFLDTEVAAIKAVTDALPNAGALTTIQADLDNIQTRIPAALVGGKMDSDVTSISGDSVAADNAEAFFDGTGYAGTGNTIPTVTTVVTLNSLASNAITAASINTGAIGQAELAADALTAIADAVLKRDMSAVTGESARSPLNALRKSMNKVGVSGATLTVYKEDDTTAAFTQAVTTDAAAVPIITLDTA